MSNNKHNTKVKARRARILLKQEKEITKFLIKKSKRTGILKTKRKKVAKDFDKKSLRI